MRDFKQQLKAYGDEMKNTHCPYSDAELDREIRNVVWHTAQEQRAITHRHRQWLWPSVVAAACLAAVLVTVSLPSHDNSSIAHVDVDGEHIYFACNNGCSAEGTLETFKTMIR